MPAARASSYSSSGPLIRRTISWTGTSKCWVRLLSSRIAAKGYTVAPTAEGPLDPVRLAQGIPNAAAAQDLVSAVEDHGLPRSHRALRGSKLHPDLLAHGLDHGGHVVALVPDPHVGLEGADGRRLARNPGHTVGHQTPPGREVAGPHHHAVRRPVHVHDVGPLARGDAQAPALSDGETERPVVMGHGPPLR